MISKSHEKELKINKCYYIKLKSFLTAMEATNRVKR
jgi:hypothetical protein